MKQRFRTMAGAAVVAITGMCAAADQVPVPEGCTAMATVHKAMCHATTLIDCGDRREAWTYRNGEPLVVHAYTPDWEMTEFRFADGQVLAMTAVPNTGSNMDLTQAVADGSVPESGDFLFNTNIIKNREYTMDGRIEMPGETVEISGVSFHKGRIFRVFEVNPGDGGLEFEIDVYVAKDRDVIFEASWQRSIFGNNTEAFDQSPMAIYFSGEAGFLATKPENGCE